MASFDAVLCNMALMDIDDIGAVLHLAHQVLKEKGVFVFSITHPCYDKCEGPHITEIHENDGTLVTKESKKIERYLSPITMTVRALPSLPNTHHFFHQPLQTYLNAAFDAGFSLVRIAEPAFPKNPSLTEHKGWHKLPEIPVALILKFKKI